MGAENGTALVQHSPVETAIPITKGEIEMLYQLANGLGRSGFFKDIRQGHQAFAKLIFGRDLGLSATQAMTEIHVIDGKPEMSANLQAAKVRASGRYDFRVLEHDHTKCSIEFGEGKAPKRDPESGAWLPWPEALGVSEFTIEDAQRAKLDGKNNWKHYPKNMLFARAMSNGVAFYCPDVMNGIRVYAEGEVTEATEATAREESFVAAELSDAEVVDGASAEDDRPLTADEVEDLVAAITAAGIDDKKLGLMLASVGVDCTDDLTEKSALELRMELAKHLGEEVPA